MARVDAWGGDADRLLEHPAVANARQPEGHLVIPPDAKHLVDTNEDLRRQLDRLQRELKKITHDRERQLSLDSSLQARTDLLQSSTVRIKQKGEASCGFDARLVFDEETWQQWLEQGGKDFLYERQGGGLDEDPEDDGKWYCARARKCDRHAGWETFKHNDFLLEARVVKNALGILTARERDLRRRMEDLEVYIHARDTAAGASAKLALIRRRSK